MKKQPTATATVKEMRALANKAEDAHNIAASHARITEHAAEDAATYAGAARICLLLTVIFNAIFAAIFYAIR